MTESLLASASEVLAQRLESVAYQAGELARIRSVTEVFVLDRLSCKPITE